MEKDTFISQTPIYYPSTRCTSAHTYCTVATDTLARYHRLKRRTSCSPPVLTSMVRKSSRRANEASGYLRSSWTALWSPWRQGSGGTDEHLIDRFILLAPPTITM